MPIEIVMPRLGWTMEEGSIVEWLKADGDEIKPGDVLFTIESDKAINEFQSFDAGILRIPIASPPAGVKVPIGTLLAYLEPAGEASGLPPPPPPSAITPPAEPPLSLAGAPPPPVPASAPWALPTTPPPSAPAAVAAAWVDHAGSATERVAARLLPAISPRARRVAAELGVAWQRLSGTGRSGRIVERDIRLAATLTTERPAALPPPPAADAEPPAPSTAGDEPPVATDSSAEAAGRARLSPLARRMAAAADLDAELLARGRAGQHPTSQDPTAGPVTATPAADTALVEAMPLSGLRRLINERLLLASQSTAPVTLTTEADATRLVRLREELKADLSGSGRPLPSYTDLLLRLTAVALGEHPALNASLTDAGIIQHSAVHIGIAVDTPGGVLVPVVRDCQNRSVAEIAVETHRLIEQAQRRASAPDDLYGGTFTITNLGMYEIDAFTPILNLPECAILGVGRIVARPVVVDDSQETIAVRRMLALSLTFDHRLVDGAPAARCLQRIKQLIERPTLWLTQ
jgi:pyruvate dehydrogenase E2 component (dihydrolipoamide acetyltransferase)